MRIWGRRGVRRTWRCPTASCAACRSPQPPTVEGLSLGEYLDEVVFPVLVVDEDVLLIAANTRRAELRPLSSLAERGSA